MPQEKRTELALLAALAPGVGCPPAARALMAAADVLAKPWPHLLIGIGAPGGAALLFRARLE